jgi:hypothetical protein
MPVSSRCIFNAMGKQLIKQCIAEKDEEVGELCRVQGALKAARINDYAPLLADVGLVGPYSLYTNDTGIFGDGKLNSVQTSGTDCGLLINPSGKRWK